MPTPAEPTLTAEEQAQLLEIQDRLIELLADRNAALTAGDDRRAEALTQEIDGLLRWRDEIRMWAAT